MLSSLVLLTAIAASPLGGSVELPFTAEEATASVGDMVAAEASSKSEAPRVKAVSDEELGFFDKYYPFVLADNLHPEVDDNLLMVWILSALLWEFAGPLWIPGALVGLDVDDEYTNEALMGWLAHLGVVVVSLLFSFTGVGSIITAIVWGGTSFYLAPVHIINTYNRHIVGSPKKKRKAREKSNAAFNALPGLPAFASNNTAAAF